jgi:hypothetical protein
MTEYEWLILSDKDLEAELSAVTQPRKLFLLGAAVLRRVEVLLPNEAARFAVEVTEQYAHGRTGLHDLLESWTTAEAGMGEGLWCDEYGSGCLCDCPSCEAGWGDGELGPIHPGVKAASSEPAGFVSAATWHARKLVRDEADQGLKAEAELREAKIQLDLYRDIVGDPFERPRPAPACVRHPGVKPLLTALAGMDGIDPVGMLALADALEENGCEERDVIDHCRARGPHFRGCWALQVLLGRTMLKLPLGE